MLSTVSTTLCTPRISRFARPAQTARVDNKQIRFQNLLGLIRETGSKAELARQTGADEAHLSQIVARGGVPGVRNVGDDLARKLEVGTGKPFGWMDHDHSGFDRGNTESAGSQLHTAPEISWVQAGKFNGVEDFREQYAEHPQIPSPVPLGRGAFALCVRGDSMTGPPGTKSFPDGCKIIIDPTIDPKPGMRVVVRLDGVDEATFKELVLDSGRYFLRALNPQYPVMPMPEDARIIGVVVGMWMGE